MADETKPQQEFEDGAQVELKSGSPVMTVSTFGDHYGEWWVEKSKKYELEWFRPHELQRYVPSGPISIERG